MASAMRALVAFLCISATFAIRGVNPADSSGYSQGQFACDDGKLTIDKSKVNDDFCDCKDGTDEPGTSACSNGKFYCANEGFQAKTVPSSRVNDGICDCCDASDEWEDESLCKDTCIEEAKEMYKEQLDQLDSIRKGVEAKRLLIEEGKKLRTEKEEKVSSSKSEKEGIEAEVKAAKELRDKLEEERKQAQANEEAEKGKEKKVEEEKVEVKETSPEQASEEVKEEKEEKFPYPKEYAAPSGDEEEPEKFPYPKEYAAPNAVEEEEEEEEEKFPYPKEYAAPNEEEEDEYPPEDLELDEENEEPSPKENDTGVQDSQELIDARQKVRDLESKVTTLNREISDAQKILDTVGLDDSLLALYGKCFTKQVTSTWSTRLQRLQQ
mmetsp:Transcript_5796/g.8588  ORF Transcript_5796/g.8588 Transcript_5796/m.8588 type:complete len:381 (-) Transcript_5796:57-1199(-)